MTKIKGQTTIMLVLHCYILHVKKGIVCHGPHIFFLSYVNLLLYTDFFNNNLSCLRWITQACRHFNTYDITQQINVTKLLASFSAFYLPSPHTSNLIYRCNFQISWLQQFTPLSLNFTYVILN